MKTKNAFEASGNSPTNGLGLDSVRHRITEAFKLVHGGMPAAEKQPKGEYSVAQEQRFHARAKNLIAAALPSSYISKTPRDGAWEISTPTESAEELIAAALRRFE